MKTYQTHQSNKYNSKHYYATFLYGTLLLPRASSIVDEFAVEFVVIEDPVDMFTIILSINFRGKGQDCLSYHWK